MVQELKKDEFKGVCSKMGGRFSEIEQGIASCEIDSMSLGFQTRYPTHDKLNIKSKNLKVSIHIREPIFEVLPGKLRIVESRWG